MTSIEKILRETTENNQEKVDWTNAWSGKYPILKRYPSEVDVPKYSLRIRNLLTELQMECGYSELDAMLVLKDILYHEYKDRKSR